MITIGRESTNGINVEVNPDVTIGNFTSIGPGTTFWGKANYPSVANPKMVCNRGWLWKKAEVEFNTSKGPIKVGHDVWIGKGCDILSGVTIGNGAIIGMKTVVSKDVPAYAVAVGHPMVIKHYRFPPEIIEKLEQIKWWDWSDEVIQARSEDFLDVDKFVEKYYDRTS